jgi:hypothetical protein
LNGFINSNCEIFSNFPFFYLGPFPLSAANPQFRKQEHYARKGASFSRSLQASVPKLSELPVLRYNRGQRIGYINLIILTTIIFVINIIRSIKVIIM